VSRFENLKSHRDKIVAVFAIVGAILVLPVLLGFVFSVLSLVLGTAWGLASALAAIVTGMLGAVVTMITVGLSCLVGLLGVVLTPAIFLGGFYLLWLRLNPSFADLDSFDLED